MTKSQKNIQLRNEMKRRKRTKNKTGKKTAAILVLCAVVLGSCAADTSQTRETPRLTLGCFGVTDTLRKAVENYNLKSGCIITITDYQDEDITAAVRRMHEDMAAGKGPDIIQFESQNINDIQLGREGLLEDLSPRLERSSVIGAENFVQPLYDLLKEEEHLYLLPTNFGINAILTKENRLNEKGNWTAEECLESLETAADTRELIWGIDRQEFMNTVKIYGLDLIAQNGTPDTFEKIADYLPERLVYCPDEEYRRNGSMFMESVLITSAEDFLYHRSAWGDDCKYTGFPGAEGNGMAFLPINSFGISSGCACKDEAWAFLESLFSEDPQSGVTPWWNFSACESRLEDQFRRTMENGSYENMPLLSYTMRDGEIIDIFPPKQEDIDVLRSMIDGITLLHRQNPDVCTEITE